MKITVPVEQRLPKNYALVRDMVHQHGTGRHLTANDVHSFAKQRQRESATRRSTGPSIGSRGWGWCPSPRPGADVTFTSRSPTRMPTSAVRSAAGSTTSTIACPRPPSRESRANTGSRSATCWSTSPDAVRPVARPPGADPAAAQGGPAARAYTGPTRSRLGVVAMRLSQISRAVAATALAALLAACTTRRRPRAAPANRRPPARRSRSASICR